MLVKVWYILRRIFSHVRNELHAWICEINPPSFLDTISLRNIFHDRRIVEWQTSKRLKRFETFQIFASRKVYAMKN